MIHQFRVRWYQQPFYRALTEGEIKRAIAIWHRRAGKDEVVLNATRENLFKRPGTYWHCFPEYKQARKAIWNGINAHTGKRRIFESFPQQIIRRMNDDDMFIEFVNGSTWQLLGSDRYDSHVGAGAVGIAYSEWALCNPAAWAYHSPMVRETNGYAAFITTPRGRNHAKKMVDDFRHDPKWFTEILSIEDTGALSPDQLDEALGEYISTHGEDLGRALFEQEYLCSFDIAIMGAYFAHEMRAVRREGRIDPTLEPAEAPVHRAWDLGVRDDTSIWWFQVVGGQVFILDCYSQSGAGVDHYAEVIEQRAQEHGWLNGIDFVPHDAKVREWGTGRTRVETMQSLGLNPQVVPMATFMDGINAARKTLPRCVFHPRCEDLGIAALEQYRREWDDEKKTFKATDVHDWASHPAAAFRYLSLSWQTIRPEPVKPREVQGWQVPPIRQTPTGRIKV
ncbi:hypothetical protein [Paracoccus sp. SSJ]|uniref:hypothetical protein n=1 Tax=Paracoccus sp. SSJ TaxID=3050636 RepID=UPI00254DDDB9|nr:hypothetical protein [Paracoccus sp. SSJ]MDK8874398.1 hypothetical protein [Paracoccus sp. SSJ]